MKLKHGTYVNALKKDNAQLTKWNYDLMKRYKVKTSDPVINDVIDRIFKRHLQGMEKFKKTMSDNSKSIPEWIEESIQEKIDDICYMVTLKSRIDKVIKDLKDKLRVAEGELSIIKGIGNNSPEMKDAKKEIEHLKKEMALVREQAQIDILTKDQELGRLYKKINELSNGKKV